MRGEEQRVQRGRSTEGLSSAARAPVECPQHAVLRASRGLGAPGSAWCVDESVWASPAAMDNEGCNGGDLTGQHFDPAVFSHGRSNPSRDQYYNRKKRASTVFVVEYGPTAGSAEDWAEERAFR